MPDTSLPCGTWQDVLSSLPSSLNPDHTAFTLGALRRKRKIKQGTDLLRLALAYGPCGMSLRSTAAWAAVSGLGELSDVAVLKRLKGAGDWLEHLVGGLISGASPQTFPGGYRLRLVDGSCISGPASKGTDYRLHAAYDPAAGSFTHLEITDVHGSESLIRAPVASGDIHIADRGYARAKGLLCILEDGGDFIVRTGWRMLRMTQLDGSEFNLISEFQEADYDRPVDRQVLIQGGSKTDSVPARLIILRKPPEARDQERARLRRTAKRKSRELNPGSLIAAEYMVLLTSLPKDQFDADSVAALYRVRWQIEIAFKRLKSLIHIDRLPAKDPDLAKTWLLSHLILALLIERKSKDALSSFPPDETSKQRTPSTWRLHKLMLQALISAIQGAWDLTLITNNASSFWRAICEPPRKRKFQQIPKHSFLS